MTLDMNAPGHSADMFNHNWKREMKAFDDGLKICKDDYAKGLKAGNEICEEFAPINCVLGNYNK